MNVHQPAHPEHAAGWTPERVEQLTQLWTEGRLSASQIASLMGGGLTRNAVIGKVHRLGLQPRIMYRNPFGNRKKRKDAKPKTPKPKRPRMILYSKAPTPEPEPVAFSAEVWEPLPGTTPISLLELSDAVCRWEVGGTHQSPGTGFCGCPVAHGRSYCTEHYARSVGKGTASERAAVRSAKQAAKFDIHQRILELA